MALPVNVNIKDFIKTGEQFNEQEEQKRKEKRSALSMRALSNTLVGDSMSGLNPNAQPISQEAVNG